ncbi:MAG: hypothetical protein IH947_13640 [Bacteroidetes bacterium]|nr:hypothetical protein [Bacteroidota bacterium]
MGRKSVLFLILVLPFVVYLFLKIFGENKYEIPVFYENGITFSECFQAQKKPFLVPDLEKFLEEPGEHPVLQEKTSLIFVYSSLNPSAEFCLNELSRLMQTKFSGYQIQALALSDRKAPGVGNGIIFVNGNSDSIIRYVNCGLVMSQKPDTTITDNLHWIVLVDSKKQIRGYYDATDYEEYDRLAAEVDILVNE